MEGVGEGEGVQGDDLRCVKRKLSKGDGEYRSSEEG